MERRTILPIPAPQAVGALNAALKAAGPWFYRFSFDNGAASEPRDEATQGFHDARAGLIFPMLDQMVGDRWGQTTCVDLACHEGWFTTQLALRGAASVVGLDLRDEHVARANRLKELSGITNMRFEQRNLYELTPDDVGRFDVTFFLGVLYHLDNPMQALRVVRSLTDGVCVIETQVARPAADLECLWGSGAERSGPGIAVVPSDDRHVEGGHDVVLVPTLSALWDLLTAAGFRHLSLAIAPRDELDQFARADRVVVFALT